MVEALAERNFDLAFRIITDFQLPRMLLTFTLYIDLSVVTFFLMSSTYVFSAVPIYAAVAANLAERKKVNQLTELFKNIKPFISDDLDEVCT